MRWLLQRTRAVAWGLRRARPGSPQARNNYGNLSKGVSVASRLSHLTEAVAGRNQCHMAAAGLGWSA